MNEILREYGKTVVAVVAATLILLIIMGKLGFWKIFEKGACITTQEYETFVDRAALEVVLEGYLPAVVYRCPHIRKGDLVPVEELFFGLDGEGNFLEVKVLSVLSPQGVETAMEEGKILFEKMG